METGLQRALNQTSARLTKLGINITPSGISFTRDLDVTEFGQAMGAFLYLDDAFKVRINFALGDLYNRLSLKHGEKKAQITDKWGLGWYHRLSKLGGVSYRIPENQRHNYALPWHVYESFGLKSIPDAVRFSGLDTAAKYKDNGQYLKREDIRDSIDPYREPKPPKVETQFSGGLAKDAEDDGLPIPPSGTARAEVQNCAGAIIEHESIDPRRFVDDSEDEEDDQDEAQDTTTQEPPQAIESGVVSGSTEEPDDTIKTQCPKCREWVEDGDGFGVLAHDACGYCSHPSRTGGVCGICGDVQAGEVGGGDSGSTEEESALTTYAADSPQPETVSDEEYDRASSLEVGGGESGGEPESRTGVCKCGHVLHLHASAGCVVCREECEKYEFAEWLDDTHCHAYTEPGKLKQGTPLYLGSEVWALLEEELAARVKAEPHDATLDSQSVGEDVMRKGLYRCKTDRGRKR